MDARARLLIRAWSSTICAFFLCCLPLSAQPFQDGEVLAGLPGGTVARFGPTGTPNGRLWVPSGGQITGMCFDAQNRLYVTDFTAKSVALYNPRGELLEAEWASGFGGNPESCVVDREGHVFVGTVEPANSIYKFDPSGRLLKIFHPRPVGGRGMDWIDLASDQCTMFYTSEGSQIGQYDVCSELQRGVFARLSGECYALRVRSNGEVMVACGERVFRLSANGRLLQTYDMPGEKLFALNLDRDGRTFWTGGINSANVYRIDIASGKGTEAAHFNAAGVKPKQEKRRNRRNRRHPNGLLDALLQAGEVFREVVEAYSGGERMGGLAVYGEILAALPKNREQGIGSAKPPEDIPGNTLDPWLPPPSSVVELEDEDADEDGGASASVDLEPEPGFSSGIEPDSMPEAEDRASQEPTAAELPPPSVEPPPPVLKPPPLPDGVLSLGAGSLSSEELELGGEQVGESELRLSDLRVRGAGRLKVSSDLKAKRVALEIEHRGRWYSLRDEPVALDVSASEIGPWKIRARAAECAPAFADRVSIFVESEVPAPAVGRIVIPLELRILPDPWWHCWWPLLAAAGSLIFGGFLLYGFVSPSRFSPRAGLVLSPEEDLSEGFFYAFRGQKGSRSGFYRAARLYLHEDFRFSTKSAGAWLRLRADGRRVRMKAIGGSLWRRAADGEWEAAGEAEVLLRPGTCYRNEMSTAFFELRQS